MFSISQLPWGLGSLCREIISATLLVLVFALAISIASLPLGIGSLFREMLGAATLVWVIFLLSKVIHSFLI